MTSISLDEWHDSLFKLHFYTWLRLNWYNETIFPNIALEWLCDHQHNSCYYSFGASAHFSLCRVRRAFTTELGVNPWLWFLSVTDVTALSGGRNSLSVNWPPQSLSRFIENLRGHRRLPGQVIQGVSPASEENGDFWLLLPCCRFVNVCKPSYNDLTGAIM